MIIFRTMSHILTHNISISFYHNIVCDKVSRDMGFIQPSLKVSYLSLISVKPCLRYVKSQFIDIDKRAVEGCFNFQPEDYFQKVFHFAIASYLKFQKFKVSNDVQSNKRNSVSYIHITK